MENNGIPAMQKDMNDLRREKEALKKALLCERAERDRAIREMDESARKVLEQAKRENAELRAVILYMLDRARADYAVIRKEPFERLSDAVYVGEINFETAENLSGDYVIRVPATDAVIGGMAGVMHGMGSAK